MRVLGLALCVHVYSMSAKPEQKSRIHAVRTSWHRVVTLPLGRSPKLSSAQAPESQRRVRRTAFDTGNRALLSLG